MMKRLKYILFLMLVSSCVFTQNRSGLGNTIVTENIGDVDIRSLADFGDFTRLNEKDSKIYSRYFDDGGNPQLRVAIPFNDSLCIHYRLYSTSAGNIDPTLLIREMEIVKYDFGSNPISDSDFTVTNGLLVGTGNPTSWLPVGGTIESTVYVQENGGIEFNSLTDGRGLYWKFKLNDSEADTALINTYNTTTIYRSQTLFSNLPAGIYKVTGEVMDYNAGGSNERGWIRDSYTISGVNEGAFTSTIFSPDIGNFPTVVKTFTSSSIKEFAYNLYPTDSNLNDGDEHWVPNHGENPLRYRPSGDSLSIYRNNEKIILQSESKYYLGSLQVLQDMQGFHQSDFNNPVGNWRLEHLINNPDIDFLCEMNFIRPVKVVIGYSAMMPYLNSEFDVITSNLFERKEATGLTEVIFDFQKDEFLTSWLGESNSHDYSVFMTVDPVWTYQQNLDLNRRDPISFLNQRADGIQKVYLATLQNQILDVGTTIFLKNKWGIGKKIFN